MRAEPPDDVAGRRAPAGSAGATASRLQVQRLYEQHASAVLGYARRRTVEAQSAQDVLAETFLIAWRRRDAIPADALPWLYATARNVLANHHRAEQRQQAIGRRIVHERPWSTSDPDARNDASGVLAALASLRPNDREALLLVAWEELDPGRAARAAGCTRAAFHVRLHRARRRLREALQRQHTENDGTPSTPSPRKARA